MQLRSLSGANADVDEARENRAMVEDLGRRVDRIENAVWQSWASTERFLIDDEALAFGARTAEDSAVFYGRLITRGSPTEARVAKKMLNVTDRGRRLMLAARSGPSGTDGRRLAQQVAAFSIERADLREEWLVENAATEDTAAAAVRRHTNTLIALLLAGLLFLTVAGVVLKLRMRRERDLSMRRLRRTAEEMAALASTDPLTGLGNQRQFYARLDMELRQAVDAEQPLTLALIDVDNFKLINDEHGHLIGDQVLLEVARRIEANAAPRAALTARVGGEEFAVVMPGASPVGGQQAAEAIRIAIQEPIVPVGVVTVSIGLTATTPEDDVISLFKRSDAALYRAKREGKNRVVADTDPAPAADGRAAADISTRPETLTALTSLGASVDDSQSIMATAIAFRVLRPGSRAKRVGALTRSPAFVRRRFCTTSARSSYLPGSSPSRAV